MACKETDRHKLRISCKHEDRDQHDASTSRGTPEIASKQAEARIVAGTESSHSPH